ncbi:hypothetical protein CLIB1423_01S03906 [[Candida] railenensis]|uniref:Uncharacterized protein n=1 Tax=[Candida] railenensis TaxID=45579 RepID=A0A9P0QKG0_9ASCO|nr:hypothetical protein CLIB1423_01S03906 [[Candida] railenensis]
MSELSVWKLSAPISKCSEQIIKLVRKQNLPQSVESGNDIDFTLLDSNRKASEDEFTNLDLVQIIEKYKFDFSIDTDSDVREGEEATESGDVEVERKKSIETFNNQLEQKTRDFILLASFKKSIQQFVKEYLADSDGTTASLVLIYRLSVIFDFHIYLIKSYPSTKTNFYQCLALATDLLFSISTSLIDKFWSYLEQRRIEFQTDIFDASSTADRIAILEICNTLTDKYYPITFNKKTDTYKKDSYNDRFQARVRIFLTNVLALEDNTGLNKYFSVSNIIGQDILTSIGTNGRDDVLVRDIIQINKLFRDPYAYVKPANYKQLQALSQTMNKVFMYLMDEEKKWYAKHPSPDQYVIPEEDNGKVNEDDTNEIIDTNANKAESEKLYFPEIYSLAAFDEVKRGERYENLKKEDSDFFAKRFDIPQVRQTVLVQIYIICTLYYELAASNKRAFFQQMGVSGSSAKHFIDDSIPESMVSLYYKIKREMPRRYRSMDAPFSHFLTHLSITEIFWWQWLINGKDASGKPLFNDKIVDKDTLNKVDEKSRTILPLKEKKYFNTYATPQLTRKMKVETGISKLEKTNDNDNELLEDKLRNNYEEARSKLVENEDESIQSQNIAFWKLLKRQRTKQWLKFGELASKEGLAEKVEVVKEPVVTRKRAREEDEEEERDDIKKSKVEEEGKEGEGKKDEQEHAGNSNTIEDEEEGEITRKAEVAEAAEAVEGSPEGASDGSPAEVNAEAMEVDKVEIDSEEIKA